MKKLLKDRVVLGLVALAAVQLAIVGFRTANATVATGARLAVGQSVGQIVTRSDDGEEGRLPSGAPTLVLVFHSECAHCLRVAPAWRAWLDEHRTDVRVIAVSSEGTDAAGAYASEHAWDVDVRTVSADDLGGAAHSLTSRTPWIFAIDGEGNILAEGHGNRIVELGALLLEQSTSKPDAAGT